MSERLINTTLVVGAASAIGEAVIFLLLNPQSNGSILTVDGGRIVQ